MEESHGCEICAQSFTSPDFLKEHMKTHAGEFKFSCQFCPAGFTKKEYLIYHERTHSDNRPFECEICGKGFKRKSHLTMHKFVHTDQKGFNCKLCNRSFPNKSRLTAHEIVHTGEKPFQCGFCPQTFATAKDLRNHQERMHEKIKTRQCEYCDKAFFSIQELEHHTNQHTGAYPYACDECGKRFQNTTSLAIHKKIHSDVKSYECDVCGSCFKQKSILKLHMLVHQADMFGCNECGRFFNRPLDLRRHKLGMHSPNDITPTVEKPYQCGICKRTFKLKAHLKRHEQGHFTDINFPCNDCHRNFRSLKALTDHRKMHDGKKYQCRKCNQKFHLKENLDAHLLRHITDKPYGCQFCNSSFKQASELKEHLLLHTGENPYFCLLCPSKFKQKSQLASHVRESHPDECEDNDEDLSADSLSSMSESSFSEYDSADTEIYMMDTEDDSETEVEEVSSLSKDSEKTLKSDEKAPITFLFCGRLEGQNDAKRGCKPTGNRSYEKMFHEQSNHIECKEHFEIWDNGASQNAFRTPRNITSVNHAGKQGNQIVMVNCSSSSDINKSGTMECRIISSSTDNTENNRQHLLDLPKLSNYAGTDNLLSWPSPQHINLFEHFDSSFETELSESFDDSRLVRNRRKVNGISSEIHANNISSNENSHVASHPNYVNSQEQMNHKRENIPHTVITSLAMDLTQNASNDLVEFNYPSDILEALLGNNNSKDDTNAHVKTHIHVEQSIVENGNSKPRCNSFADGINTAIQNEQPKSDSNNCTELSNHIQQSAEPQYIAVSLQPSSSNKSNAEASSMANEKEVTGTFKESSQNVTFWPGLGTNTGKFPKANWSALKAGVAENKETSKKNCSSQNLFESLTISPKKECLFEKKGKSMRDGDRCWKYDSDMSEIELKKQKREGKFVKADKNISFFVSGNYSTVDECSSVDNDIADSTTIEDVSCVDSDNETIRTGDLADDSLQDTDSAPGSPHSGFGSDNESIVSEQDTISEYDSSMEGENSMTDNCSSVSSDDEVKIKIPHQKSHTRECLRKKDIWLKRNFKFKIDKFGSRNCVSYVIQKKNYSDHNRHNINSNVSDIQNKYGKNTNITEEKLAGIRDMIRKKHIRRRHNRSGSVNLSANETNNRNKASPARSQESWKMYDMESNQVVERKCIDNLTGTNEDVMSGSDDVTESVFKISSPRYKTRHTDLKIGEKQTEKKSLKITLVKSNVNINRIASPRYKTRYAEIKFAEKLREITEGDTACHEKKTDTSLNSDSGEKSSTDNELNTDNANNDIESIILSSDGNLDISKNKKATAHQSSKEKRSKVGLNCKNKKTKAQLSPTKKNAKPCSTRKKTRAHLDSTGTKKKAKAPLKTNKKTIVTRLTLKNMMNNSETAPAGEDNKDSSHTVIPKKGRGQPKKTKATIYNQITDSMATEIISNPNEIEKELQVKLSTGIDKETSQIYNNNLERTKITRQRGRPKKKKNLKHKQELIEPEQSKNERSVNQTTRRKNFISQENAQVRDKTEDFGNFSNVKQRKMNVNVITDNNLSNMTNVQVETSVADSHFSNDIQHVKTLQPGIGNEAVFKSKTSLESQGIKIFGRRGRNKSKKNSLNMNNSINGGLDGEPLNIGPHHKEDITDSNIENLVEGKRGRKTMAKTSAKNELQVETRISKSKKYGIECINDPAEEINNRKKNSTKSTEFKTGRAKEQNYNDLQNKQTQLSHGDRINRKQNIPKYKLRKGTSLREENLELELGTNSTTDEENIEKLGQPEKNYSSGKRKKKGEETEIIRHSKRRKLTALEDDLINLETNKRKELITNTNINSLNTENSTEQIQTNYQSMEMSCSKFYPSVKTGRDNSDKNSFQSLENVPYSTNDQSYEENTSTDRNTNLSSFPDKSLNEFQSFIQNRVEEVAQISSSENDSQSDISQNDEVHVQCEELTVIGNESEDLLSNIPVPKDASNKLPYESDGYIISVPNFVIPSYENTRLKCRERENIFRVLVNGETNDKSDEDVEDNDEFQRGRQRKRQKSNHSQKRKKGKKRSESVDSVFSNGSRHHKISKYHKGKGRSSSVDSVLSKKCKRPKMLKKRKKRHRRSSSADTVLSKRSSCHDIEMKKKPSKRSCSADRAQSREYLESYQKFLSQNYYHTFENFKRNVGNPKNRIDLARYRNIFEKDIFNRTPYSEKTMSVKLAKSANTTKRPRSTSPIKQKLNKLRIPVLEKYDVEVGFKFAEEKTLESRSLELFNKRFGEGYLIKEDIGKKLRDKCEAVVRSFVRKCKSNEKKTSLNNKPKYTKDFTEIKTTSLNNKPKYAKDFTEILCKQPVIKLFRVDSK